MIKSLLVIVLLAQVVLGLPTPKVRRLSIYPLDFRKLRLPIKH